MRRIPRYLPALVLSGFTALALFGTGAASAGLMFKQVSKGGGEKGFDMATRVSIDTGGAKFEFLDSSNPMMPAGSYMLMRPDDDSIYLVNPEKKTYAAFDMGAMMQSMTAMMQPPGGQGGEGAPKTEASKPIVEKLLEEDGGTILGRPTKHFRYHLKWTMTMTVAPGMAMITDNDQIQDSWVADIPIDPKIARNFENLGAGLALPDDMKELAEAQKETMKGLPLKRVTVNKTHVTGTGMMAAMAKMMAKDGDKPTTTTFEVVELSEAKIPASEFAIPKGYTETEMMSPGMKMPDMNKHR